MSLEVSKLVWAYSKAKGSARLVLLAIADFADDKGVAWPGVGRIRKMTGLSRRSAQNLIQHLISLAELTIAKKGSGRHTNRYQIEVQRLHQCKDCTPRVQPSARQGRKVCAAGVQPSAPKPSGNHQGTINQPSRASREAESAVELYPLPKQTFRR